MNNKGETPLYIACVRDEEEHYGGVTLLLANGANPNLQPDVLEAKPESQSSHSVQSQGRYPLTHAVSISNVRLISLLLENGADPNNVDIDGNTVLHLAADSRSSSKTENSSYMVSELLLNAKANPNVLDHSGETPLYKACNKNNSDVALLLLKHNADPNLTTNNKYPLIAACLHNNETLIQSLLDRGAKPVLGVNYTAPIPSKTTQSVSNSDWPLYGYIPVTENKFRVPLCIAADKHNFTSVDNLLKSGANVNQKDYWGKTALHIVAAKKDASAQRCAMLLLEHKADVNIACDDNVSPFYLACSGGCTETVEFMLQNSSPRINVVGVKQPLVAACANNNLAIVKQLVQHGANVNARSPSGTALTSQSKKRSTPTSAFELPLGVAAMHDYCDIVLYLIANAADINATDNKGNTALHHASDRSPRSLTVLLEHGAAVNLMNACGKTALCKATIRRVPLLVRELIKFEANPNITKSKDYPLFVWRVV